MNELSAGPVAPRDCPGRSSPGTGAAVPSPRAGVEAGRIVWLDVLRAVAVLLVAVGHVFMVGINGWQTVNLWLPLPEGPVFGPDGYARNPVGAWGDIVTRRTGANVAGLGVGVFFLVSGYVILRTVDCTPPLEFLVRRAFRIFPLLIVAVLGTAAGTALYCGWAGAASPHSVRAVLFSAFAVADLAGAFPVLPVLWTLRTELAFYLLIAIVACAVPRIRLGTLAGMAAGCLGGVFAVVACRDGSLLPEPMLLVAATVGGMLVHVSFMLIGAALYRGQSEGRMAAGAAVAGVIGAIYLLAASLPLRPEAPVISPADAFYSVLVFAGAAWLRPGGAWTVPLRWIAAISYPLYLVHVPLAWAGLVLLARAGLGPTLSGVLSLAATVLLAWALHVLVERPGNRLGRLVARGAA